MDKILSLLQGIKKDVGELRADMEEMSTKVDSLTTKNTTFTSEDDLPEKIVSDTSGEVITEELPETIVVPTPEEDTVTASSIESKEIPVVKNSAEYKPRGPRQKSIIEKFFIWLAKDWPMKIGGFFVIAAIGWFVTYAAKVGWLSETARIVLGYIVAVSCIAFGSLRAEKERTQGNIFLIIGVAAILISTLAGLNFDKIPASIGLFIMLISVGFVTLISLKQKNIALTASMIFFGAIIPTLFFTGEVDINTIFIYLFILTVGTLWIVYFTGWEKLATLMLLVVGFYSLIYIISDGLFYGSSYGTSIETIFNVIVAFLFGAVFYIANVSAIVTSTKITFYHIVNALGIGFLMLVWIISFAQREFEVPLLLLAALFFAIASYLIFMHTRKKTPTLIYGGVFATLFTVATARQFDGQTLTVAFLTESSAAIIITLYIIKEKITQGIRSFLLAIYFFPIYLSLLTAFSIFRYLAYTNSSYTYSVNSFSILPNLFTIFMVCITSFAIALTVLRFTNGKKENLTFFRVFVYTGGLFSLMLVWFITHIFISDTDLATFVSLVIYTLAGLIFYVNGVKNKYKPYLVVGGILFAIVIARVILVEFWAMNMIMRVVTSFVLGALLISTSFIKKSKK